MDTISLKRVRDVPTLTGDIIFWSSIKILATILLVLLNGFFVAAEFSLIKIRKTRLAEMADDGNNRAAVALEVASRIDAYLSASQLGITLASLGLGWLGEPAIASLLEPAFRKLGLGASVYVHTAAVVLAFIMITYLHIVLGELVPKSLAIQRVETIALGTAGLLKLFRRLFYPVIWTLNKVAAFTLGILDIKPGNEADLAHTEEELRMLVDASQKYGHLDKMEGKLLDNVFEFSDRVVGEVMIPRQDIVCLYLQDSVDEIMGTVRDNGFTRYPLCDDDKDNVLGMVHIRDIIWLMENPGKRSLAELKRNILLVPEGLPVSHLVQRMRAERTHIAVVADEFGGTAGLATIEDLIEELVGEIYDEFDQEQPEINKIGDDEYEFQGRVLLEDVSETLGIEMAEELVNTIGGYIFARLGRKPRAGDEVEFGGWVFRVLEVSGPRVLKVAAVKKEV